MLSTVWLSFSKPVSASTISGQLSPSISIFTIGPRFNEMLILAMSGLLLRFVLPRAGRRRLGAARSGAAGLLAVEAAIDLTEGRGESAE